MSYSISTLLLRNLSDVFGENDPVRRRAAIDDIWHEDGVFYDPNGGVYRGRDAIDRIAGVIKATHPDFRYQPIVPREELGNGGWVHIPPSTGARRSREAGKQKDHGGPPVMNTAFHQVIAASDEERRDLFLATARPVGTAVQNVEKDFRVCWTLDVLFNGLGEGQPRLLFKGGTSLSKSFGLIDRFSEDIDITVFGTDVGEPASIEDLEALSGKKGRARLDAIKAACQVFINGSFLRKRAPVSG